VISLPTERLDKHKRYYVTFTIKGGPPASAEGNGQEDPEAPLPSEQQSSAAPCAQAHSVPPKMSRQGKSF